MKSIMRCNIDISTDTHVSSKVHMLSRLVYFSFHQMQRTDHASLLTWTQTGRISLRVTICHGVNVYQVKVADDCLIL